MNLRIKLSEALYAFLIFLLLPSCGIILQQSSVKNFKVTIDKPKQLKLNDYQYDFLYMAQVLEEGFPKLDEQFPEEERLQLQENILERLKTKPGKTDFLIQSSKYLARLQNQHTGVNLELELTKRYPFWIHIYQNKWYLFNVDQSIDSSLIGNEILSINQWPAGKIEKELSQFTFSENKISQQYNIRTQQFFNFPPFLKEIGLISKADAPISIELENGKSFTLTPSADLNNRLYTISLPRRAVSSRQPKSYFYKLFPQQNFTYLQFNNCHDSLDIIAGMKNYIKPWLNPMARNYVRQQMKKMSKGKNTKLPIAQYYNPEYPVFSKMIWEMIELSNQKKIGNLVIDLRNNPGGNTIFGKQLLYFLTNKNLKDFTEYVYTSELNNHYFKTLDNQFRKSYYKKYGKRPEPNQLYAWPEAEAKKAFFEKISDPKSLYYIQADRPRFKGKVFLLANYGTGSAAALITCMFQDNNMATIIGTSVSNNPTGATTWTPMQLPKTKASITIASQYQQRPVPEKGKIQIPDHWVEFSMKDLQLGRDPYLLEILKLFKN